MALEPIPRLWVAEKVSHGYVADYKPFSFVDGEGVRCSLYVSGCLFKCVGCFNEDAWSFRCGRPYDEALQTTILEDLAHESVQGLSLLGGEPFLNTQVALRLVTAMRERFGDAKDVWCWTGYTFDELVRDSQDKRDLLNQIDVLVDGRYEHGLRDLSLAHRGSRNQRVLAAAASVRAGRPIPYEGVADPMGRMDIASCAKVRQRYSQG
ncbi:anaerobic ribonucleoside-triphosphate reductase activating protein [Demequina capsici]|uniref:Anaerobic ribonucleoside-triphosphate reductase activating protein n=1 Tax=Demequina capsici TaxID=3075620 RepID=A0AA96JEL7_9MICO|nr:anaerobic ribonucleoside-triphosphate reductase activating protein [Demequina sp. OYTSA14]WNM25859.1 anaerobic ribonucleoside-triphosphate reductase activating protein [Demequina sp. OYTSA14]